jgi:Kef-type K+ transport system membrane component KefB
VEHVWLIAALWIGLALVASVLSVWLTVSVALTEIVVGAVAGNLIHLQLNDWINWLAGFGAILLTFLAGPSPIYFATNPSNWATTAATAR